MKTPSPPSRTSPPQLTPVESPDWSDRGPPLLRPATGAWDDWTNLRKKSEAAPTPPKRSESTLTIPATPVTKEERFTVAPSPATIPKRPEAPPGVQAFTALVIALSVLYAYYERKRLKRRLTK